MSDSYKIVSVLSFPDHHKYSRPDIERIAAVANRYPTSVLVTTEKMPSAFWIAASFHQKFVNACLCSR